MDGFEVTKMGERGQVVIPQEFRKRMGLHRGEKFIVVSEGDALLFKRLSAPSLQEFEFMLGKAHAHAARHRIRESDTAGAIKKAREK